MTGQPCSPDRSLATNGRPRARLVRLDGAASFAHRPYCSRHHCCVSITASVLSLLAILEPIREELES